MPGYGGTSSVTSPTNEILCPGCNAELEERVAIYTDEDGREVDYTNLTCPRGCNLWEF